MVGPSVRSELPKIWVLGFGNSLDKWDSTCITPIFWLIEGTWKFNPYVNCRCICYINFLNLENSKRSCNIEILDNWYRVSIMHAYVFWKNPDKVTRCQLSVSLSKRYEAREKFPRKYFGCFSGLWNPRRCTVNCWLAYRAFSF